MSETEAVAEMQTFEVLAQVRLQIRVRVAAEDGRHVEEVMSELTVNDLAEYVENEDVDVEFMTLTSKPPQLIGEKWDSR